MQQVNLLVDELRPKKEVLTFRQLLLMWGCFGGLLALVSGWQGVDLWQLRAEQDSKAEQVDVLQRANAQLKASITTKPDPALVAEVETLRQMQANQEILVSAVLGYEATSEEGFSAHLTDLARHHVRGMWLSQISFEDGGSRIQLKGQTVDPVHVPVFLKRLSRGQSFRGHRFDGLELQEQESGLVQFNITGPAEARSG